MKEKCKWIIWVIVSMSLLLGPFTANAQSSMKNEIKIATNQENKENTEVKKKGKTIAIDEVVVTATRRPVKLENAPAVVDVITAGDIKKLPAQNLADLLVNVVGVQVDQPQGQGIVTPQSITIRGLESTQRSLLLVDGQPWNSSFTDYFYFSQIPVEAIERIEVVRGPFSSLYGSNALAGVIQIFTKDGWGKKMELGGSAKFGNFDRLETSETVAGSIGSKASVFVSHSHYETDNYYLNDDQKDVLDIDNRVHEHERFHAHSLIRPSDTLEIRLSGGYFDAQTGYGITSTFQIPFESDTERLYLNGRGSWWPKETMEVFFSLDYQEDEHESRGETLTNITTTPPPPKFTYELSKNISGYDKTRAQAGANLELSNQNTLTIGGEYNWVRGYKKIVNRDTGELLDVRGQPGEEVDEKEKNYSFFLQDDWLFFKNKLEFVPGLRYDKYEGFGDEWSPKAALIWYYTTCGRVKISGGKAFRAPSFSSRKTPPWTMSPFLTYIANPDLKAETVKSYEISLENEFLENKLKSRITPFLSKADNFIQTATLIDPLDPSGKSKLKQPQNIQKVKIEGIETEFTYVPLDKLKLFLNYQYVETRDEDTDKILDDHPLNRARFGGSWYSRHFSDILGFSTGLSGRYGSGRTYTVFRTGEAGRLGGYTVWDARLSVDFWKQRLSLFADIYNLFNKEYYRTAKDDYLPERNWMAGAKVSYEF